MYLMHITSASTNPFLYFKLRAYTLAHMSYLFISQRRQQTSQCRAKGE